MTNTIAALIPVYNKEPYVERAIRSVLHQTRPVDEIVIVDDGSTDGSLARINAFPDSRIRVIRRPRCGPGPNPARNVGIRGSTARWIAFLDADDEWHENFIEEIGRSIDDAPESVGCVFTGWQNVWPNGVVVTEARRHAGAAAVERLDFDRFVSTWLALRSCPVWTSATAVRRDILVAAGLFPERCYRGGDKDTWLRILAITDAQGSDKACSSYYRVTANQITRTGNSNARHCLCPTLESMISTTSGRRRRQLMRLFNCEVFDYAMQVGQRERVSPEVYRGFHAWLNPMKYCALLAFTYLPVPAQQVMRSLALSLVHAWRRPASKWQTKPS